MADRTARTSINLSPSVRDALNSYQAAMEREAGVTATQEQLIGALLHGVPTWQADHMLRAYTRHTADRPPRAPKAAREE